MEYLVYLLYPLAALLLFFGSKWYGRKQWNEDYFSLSQVKAWQGFFALLIVLHHAGQKTIASWLPRWWPRLPGLEPFVPTGYYFVGIFLVISGYGLYKSCQTKQNYLKGFVAKRIVPMIILFYAVNFLYLILRFCVGEKMDTRQIIYYVTGIQQANPNSWYILSMPIFYLIFYLCFRFVKKEGWALFCTTLGILLWVLLGCAINHNDYWICGEWWYNSALFFPIGMLFARYEKKLIPHFKKYYILYMVLSFVGIFALYRYSVFAQNYFGYYCEWLPQLSGRIFRRFMTVLAQMIAAFAFVFFVFMLGLKVKIGNRVLKFMSGITLEFYLVHGLFIEFFAVRCLDKYLPVFYIRNAFFYVLAVIACAIPATLLVKKLLSFIMPKPRLPRE